MDQIKNKLYKIFDVEGIKLKPIAIIDLKMDHYENTLNTNTTKSYLPYESQRDEYNLTNENFIDIIIDYIYDTTSVRIKKLEDLEKYPSINNLPFILKINENNNDPTIF